jgi:LmbE family N-acetylglucosaminyl deacetylase
MPLTARDRIHADRLHPRLVDLWFAVSALRRVTSFMQSGAHPDDETSAMLAALRFRDGLSTSYVCSTRGEGGQNDIGTEAGAALGALRTAEMERAADRLDLRMWWLSDSPGDTITDFGFSKSGPGTLRRWDEDRTLARFVDVLRMERPDILCPTFLDVPGQHGHHRAMTALAYRAVEAAADPAYPGNGAPWQVAKLYLPAWGGGGTAYDDEVPPPPATVTVPGKGCDPVSGWTWERIGQQSRAFHATQGMGAWVAAGTERDWPLHLAASRVGADAGAVTDNLPGTLADIGLPDAQRAVDAAIAAFPDSGAVARHAAQALTLLREAPVPPEHMHRVARKMQELARVLRLASGVDVRGRLASDWLVPGESVALDIEMQGGRAEGLIVVPDLPSGWQRGEGTLTLPADAPPSDPYPVSFDPLDPAAPCLQVVFTVMGQAVEDRIALEVPPVVLPDRAATVTPPAAVLNLTRSPAALAVALSGLRPEGAQPAFALPAGWAQAWDGPRATLTPPRAPPPGVTVLPLMLDGAAALSERRLTHAHTAPRLVTQPAQVRVLAVAATLAPGRVGYVGAGNDRVGHWLAALGADVAEPDDSTLANANALAAFDVLVIGVFAFRFRPGLAAAAPALRAWVQAGGTLVTLYHRPWDSWTPDTTPPRRLEIGQPSLRWRVTDAGAEVTHLAPDHPVLTGPNRIGPDDWDGWVKERGLYFAKSWDEAYTPLLSMADPGEAPHKGALLSADIGRGRHSHVALGLHVQMEALVPGAFRLMANLIAPRVHRK